MSVVIYISLFYHKSLLQLEFAVREPIHMIIFYLPGRKSPLKTTDTIKRSKIILM